MMLLGGDLLDEMLGKVWVDSKYGAVYLVYL